MAKHAVLSPSSAKRWMTCPGSVILSEGIVDKSSEFADEGTAAHFLAAHCLRHNQNAALHLGAKVLLLKDVITGEHAEAFEGGVLIPSTGRILNSFKVDADMARHVQVYLDYVHDVMASTNGELFVEVEVPLMHITGESDAKGTSDAVILAGDEIIVIDLKYGMGVEVSAVENPQLLMYASGARKDFELAGDFSRIRMAISQPRISTQPSEWDCPSYVLDEFEGQVVDAASNVWRMKEGDIPLVCVPEGDACKWCKAKASCKELDKKVQAEIGADFDNLLTSAPPKIGRYEEDTSYLSKKMACISLIEDWCKAIRSEVEKLLLSGQAVEGYKLVQGRKGARSWANAEEAEAMLKSMRLKIEQMYDMKVISPTTAEKVLAESPKRWAKVQPLITQSEGKPSVAPVTDKRPAITVTPVADDFEVV